MLRKSSIALAHASLLLVPLLGACTPVPSKSGAGEQAAEAKPEDTCKHVRELADKDSDDAALLDQVERECIETLTALQTRYETFTTCVGLAADANAIYECEKGLDKPRSLLASVGPAAKLEALCDHVLKMLEQELGDAASQMQPGEMATLRTQCIEDAGKQLETKGAEAFNKEADCILAATTIEAMQTCGL
jgi:hypothetical protein